MSEHAHPHGIVGPPNPERVWVCECGHTFSDEEARRDAATGEWGHPCKVKPLGSRCEGHLDAYLPEEATPND